jgi:NADP+-dependent farnesol dehydrogenase
MNQVIDTNFRGLLHCTRRAFKLMSASNDFGLIVNINSVAGHLVPMTDFSLNVYCPTKFAARALTESIRHELFNSGNKKIRVGVSVGHIKWNFKLISRKHFQSISPGLVESNFAAASKYFDNLKHHTFSDVPLLKPIEVAKCVMFMLSTPYEVNVNDIIVRSTGEQF